MCATLLPCGKTTKNQLEVLPRHEDLKEREAVNFNNVVKKDEYVVAKLASRIQ